MAKARQDKYVQKWAVTSFTDPDQSYNVALDRLGVYSCSCKAWIFQRKNPSVCPGGHCKHIQAMLANLDRKAQKQLAAVQANLLAEWNVQDVTSLPDLGMQESASREW